MPWRTLLLLALLASWVPAGALALGLGPPLATPPSPEVPVGPVDLHGRPETPPVEAPPIALALPAPERRPLAGLIAVEQGGPPSPLPPQTPVGPPNLVGIVDLPDGAAEQVHDHAPPFGGSLPPQAHGRVSPVPEPSTALLLTAGLTALALRRRSTTAKAGPSTRQTADG